MFHATAVSDWLRGDTGSCVGQFDLSWLRFTLNSVQRPLTDVTFFFFFSTQTHTPHVNRHTHINITSTSTCLLTDMKANRLRYNIDTRLCDVSDVCDVCDMDKHKDTLPCASWLADSSETALLARQNRYCSVFYLLFLQKRCSPTSPALQEFVRYTATCITKLSDLTQFLSAANNNIWKSKWNYKWRVCF